MGLYDGDMVNLLTPDGRAVSMPSGLAGMFPGLQPPPVAPGIPGDLAGGAGPGPAVPPAAAPVVPPPSLPAAQGPQDGPVTDPSQLAAPTGSPPRPQGPVTSPDEPLGPPQQRAPEPVQSNQQLAKNFAGRAIQESDRAMDEERQGVIASARVQADEATREGARLAQRDAETERILQERAKQAAANEAELNARISARDQLADQIAKTRIDRSVDHPIWSQVGLVLSMLGTAMTRRPGEAFNDPAYATLMQLIDRKVQGQMQDLDQKRASLAQMNVGVTEQRQHNLDRLTEIDARRDAAIQQAQQAVQTIATQMKAPTALADGQKLIGKLDQERAKLHADYGKAAQDQINTEAARAQTMLMHQQSLAVTMRGQNMEQARFDKQIAEQERTKMAQIAAELLKEGKAEAAAKMKMVSEQGIIDPSTGRWLLNEQGQAKMAKADEYEARARRADPETAQKLTAQAQALRASAQQEDMAIGLNKKGSEEAQEHLKQAQDIRNRIDIVRQKLQAEPSATDREAWASLKVYIDGIKRDYAQGGKERLSPLALKSMEDILSIDPTSIVSRTVDRGKALSALDALDQQTAQSADVAVKNAGVSAGWKPYKASASPMWEGQTAQEIADASRTGGMAGAVIAAAGPGARDPLAEQAYYRALSRTGTLADGSPGTPSNYGLDPKQEDLANALITRAGQAGDAEYRRVLDDLAQPLLKISGKDARPSLAKGVAEKLRDADPKLLDDVLTVIANRPGGGTIKADEIRKALPTAPTLTPASSGGLTPDAAADLAAMKDRVSRGLPPVPQLSGPTPTMRDVSPVQLPEVLRNAPPAVQKQYLDMLRSRGFADALGGQ